MGWLGSLAQNSWERQNVRAPEGKNHSAANDRLCLSGTERLADVNRGHVVFSEDEKTSRVSTGTCPGREKELPNQEVHRMCCVWAGIPGNVPPSQHREPLGFTSHELPLSENVEPLGNECSGRH